MLKPDSNSDIIRSTILTLLAPAQGRIEIKEGGIDASTRLLEAGLIDSKNLLDIILEVEKRCDVRFNPEHIDFERGITLGSLVTAFDPAAA